MHFIHDDHFRAFDELGLKTVSFASLVPGVLVMEDLVAILLLVLLSTVAVSQQFSGGALLFEMGKLGFFMVLWFTLGIFLIPTLLTRLRKWMNDETLLIVSVAMCLGMVYLAVQAGFSAQLGAFVMGSLLAETSKAERHRGHTGIVRKSEGRSYRAVNRPWGLIRSTWSASRRSMMKRFLPISNVCGSHP